MGFNISQIINKFLPVQEQNSYDFVFIPPKNSSYSTSGFTLIRGAKQMDAMYYLFSATAGNKLIYRFRGRRIGLSLGKATNYGKISFDIDGVAYGVFDASDTDAIYYNVPYVVATDLTDEEHILTITKLDSNGTAIQGFLVDNTSYGQVYSRAATDFDNTYDYTMGIPKTVGTTDTVINTFDFWTDSVVMYNSTASPITVTLKNGAGNVFGAFIIPANDSRVINAKMYFAGGIKAIATATGCSIVVGGQ
jgi:hypothetical protein